MLIYWLCKFSRLVHPYSLRYSHELKCNGQPHFWASIRAIEVDDVTKDKRVMDGEAVVHDIFLQKTEDDQEDWNKSNDEDSTMHKEDSFATDRH